MCISKYVKGNDLVVSPSLLVPTPVAFLEEEKGGLLGRTEQHGNLVLVSYPEIGRAHV